MGTYMEGSIPCVSNKNTKNTCLRYLLNLSFSFHHFAHNHFAGFKLYSCNDCGDECIDVYIKNKLLYHKINMHITHFNIEVLIEQLEHW